MSAAATTLTADHALEACRVLGLPYEADLRSETCWHARCPTCALYAEGLPLTIHETTRDRAVSVRCGSKGCEPPEIMRALANALSGAEGGLRIVSVRASEVQAEQTAWLDRLRIPLGDLTILGGAPGRGKTQLMLKLAARVTRGMLDGDLLGERANVAYVSAEDSIARTLLPRFLAAGGDPTRMHFFEGKRDGDTDDPGLELPDDVSVLRRWLESLDARMFVLDPVIAMIPAGLSGHRDQHVRLALAPLAGMAHDLKLAVVCLMHLTKDREADALNRLNGSVAFGAAARSVLLLADDPDDPDGENGNRRILAHVKSNLGPKQPSQTLAIEPRVVEGLDGPVETSVLVEQGESAYSASDLLEKATSTSEASARDEAREFLIAELAAGPVATNVLKARAGDAAIAWRTVERAKKALSVRARKTAEGWQWQMPDNPSKDTGGLGELGGLPVGTGDSLKPPLDGLDDLGGVNPSNTAKTDNTVTANGWHPLGDLDADAELDRLTHKFETVA